MKYLHLYSCSLILGLLLTTSVSANSYYSHHYPYRGYPYSYPYYPPVAPVAPYYPYYYPPPVVAPPPPVVYPNNWYLYGGNRGFGIGVAPTYPYYNPYYPYIPYGRYP